MLGGIVEAEEMVQDAGLRWHETAHAARGSAEARLGSVTTGPAIDRLRAARVQRAHYRGWWLAESIGTDVPAAPEQMVECADDMALAFLILLEPLAPDARAALLRRELCDAGYPEMACMLGTREAACRQMVTHLAHGDDRQMLRGAGSHL